MERGDQGEEGRRAAHEWASRGFWIATAAIVLAGGFLRFQSLDSGLPHPRTRPDESRLIQRTELPARGEFDLNWTVYPSAYVYLHWLWGEAGLWVGQKLDRLPPDDYVTTLRESPATILLIDRALSAGVGTLTVLLVILLTRRELGQVPALLAGLLLATNFLHARDSHAAKTDVLLAFWVVVALAAMLPLARRATVRGGAVAGLATGAAMATKYPGMLLLLPTYVAAVIGSPAGGWRRLLPVSAVAAGCVAAAFFLATSPFLILNRDSLAELLSTVGLLFPQLLPFLPATEASDGFAALSPSPAGWRTFIYHARFSLWFGVGIPATLLAPVAVAWGLAHRRPLLLLSSIFAITWYIVVSMSPHLYARYLTPLIPILMILEAALLAATAARLGRVPTWVVLALSAAVLVAQPLASTLAFNRLAGETDTRVLATRWLAEQLPAGSRLAVHGTVLWNWGVPELPPGIRWVDTGPEVQALEQARVGYLLTHDHELFSSTVDPAVLAALEPRLRLLVDFDPRKPGRTDAVFEGSDAYYIPFHGFDAVTRPGPRIRIYAFE